MATTRFPSWLLYLVSPTEPDDWYQREYEQKSEKMRDKIEWNDVKIQQQMENQAQQLLDPHMDAKKGRMHVVTQEEQDKHDTELVIKFLRRLFAELVGTFIFIYLVASLSAELGLTLNGHRPAPALNQTGFGYASGLALAFLILAFGQICGAHFNPAVTWAFALRGVFPLVWMPFYWLAQFGGAIVAGGFVRGFYWSNAALGTCTLNPEYRQVTGFLYEAVLTYIFVGTVLAMATKGGNVGQQAAFADGFAFAVISMLGASYTGVAANPFRALGPGIINGSRLDLWIYVAGPFLGSTVSVLTVYILNGPIKPEDKGQAQGSGEAEGADDNS